MGNWPAAAENVALLRQLLVRLRRTVHSFERDERRRERIADVE
jgi:hypothetical protein